MIMKALDAAPTDHKQNFMMPEEQESYKYVLYAEGNYGWANRLKTLLAMGMLEWRTPGGGLTCTASCIG